jgi:guanosine-3',5'-bis(diphosphate) 3'-pyrophosphohydrolase
VCGYHSLILPPGGCIPALAQLFSALRFAAHRHRGQNRKDIDQSPYINHPIEVAAILATEGGVTDLSTLIAAVLHDTVEDTETSPGELEERFGPQVRALVMELTDDKTLPKAERKRLQVEHARGSSLQAKLIKFADKIANVRDVTARPPGDWSLDRRREYLDWTEEVLSGCRGCNADLERCYDAALRAGRAALEA